MEVVLVIFDLARRIEYLTELVFYKRTVVGEGVVKISFRKILSVDIAVEDNADSVVIPRVGLIFCLRVILHPSDVADDFIVVSFGSVAP